MAYEERNAWLSGIIALLGYGLYWVLLLPELGDARVEDTAFQQPMLVSIALAILAGIVGGIVLGAFGRRGEPRTDVRDRDISRLGERVGFWLVIAGALIALVLALIAAAPFWIANAIYLGFVLSALVSAIVRLLAYRGGIRA